MVSAVACGIVRNVGIEADSLKKREQKKEVIYVFGIV